MPSAGTKLASPSPTSPRHSTPQRPPFTGASSPAAFPSVTRASPGALGGAAVRAATRRNAPATRPSPPGKQRAVYEFLRAQLADRERALIGRDRILAYLDQLGLRPNGNRISWTMVLRWGRNQGFPLLRGNTCSRFRTPALTTIFAVTAWLLSRFSTAENTLFRVYSPALSGLCSGRDAVPMKEESTSRAGLLHVDWDLKSFTLAQIPGGSDSSVPRRGRPARSAQPSGGTFRRAPRTAPVFELGRTQRESSYDRCGSLSHSRERSASPATDRSGSRIAVHIGSEGEKEGHYEDRYDADLGRGRSIDDCSGSDGGGVGLL
jgi:hypothetical protein